MLSIPRGIVYHSLIYDIKSLLSSFFLSLGNKDEVRNFEKIFSEYMGAKYCIAFPYARTAIYFSLKVQQQKIKRLKNQHKLQQFSYGWQMLQI